MRARKVDARSIDFEDFYYSRDDLGLSYNSKKASVKLWAPVANRVEVVLFKNENDVDFFLKKNLKKKASGVWEGQLYGDFHGFYYLFHIHYEDGIKKTVDPYAKAVGTNSNKGLIVDLKNTNPPDWEKDQRVGIDPLDSVIYEVHVRDFSSSSDSGMKNKGLYLAFTEQGVVNPEGQKTGVDHLKELGITHVHLLPVNDFASVCDKERSYNWGYDPHLYMVPEGSYSTDPADESRIIEFKKLVKSLHDNGIGVIIDMVFNHTYQSTDSIFQKTAPNYFYRFVDDYFANGSGCGNEIATERPMVRKLIVDAVKYWAKEYHVDGFRFDLMGLIDRETMREVESELHKIDSSIIIYGEPWSALDPQLDWERQMTKGTQKGMNVGVFNDHFREAIKDSLIEREDKKWEIKKGLVGSIGYSEAVSDFAYQPIEVVNYVSCHDNLTFWDKLSLAHPNFSENDRVKMHRLAAAVVLTSQGVPFLHGGAEFMRTKYFNDNSYNSGDDCNQFKWNRKAVYENTFEYFRGLISLRKKFSEFRIQSSGEIRNRLRFIMSPHMTVGFKIIGKEDMSHEMLVFYNFQNHWIRFEIGEEKKLGILVDDQRAGIEVFNNFRADNVKVPPLSAMVLKRLN